MRYILIFAAAALVLAGCRPMDVRQELTKASKAAEKGNWTEALDITENCLKEVPGHLDATVLRALCLFQAQRTEAAAVEKSLELLLQASALAPERYDIQLIYGWELLQLGRSKEALGPLRRAHELHQKPENIAYVPQQVQGSIKYLLGECCRLNNLNAEAITYFALASHSTPFNSWSELYNNLAVLSVLSGKTLEAVQWIRQAQTLKPMDSKVAINTAVICDFLSYPEFNAKSFKEYQQARLQWYAYAREMIKSRISATASVAEKSALQQVDRDVARRLREISPR